MIVPYQLRKMIEQTIRGYVSSSRQLGSLGANVVAANNLTLGQDNNRFIVTGATQINLLDSTGWTPGSVVVLIFNGGPTIKHNQAANGAFLPMWLNGNTDFATSNPATLSLLLTATFWVEVGRKA